MNEDKRLEKCLELVERIRRGEEVFEEECRELAQATVQGFADEIEALRAYQGLAPEDLHLVMPADLSLMCTLATGHPLRLLEDMNFEHVEILERGIIWGFKTCYLLGLARGFQQGLAAKTNPPPKGESDGQEGLL